MLSAQNVRYWIWTFWFSPACCWQPFLGDRIHFAILVFFRWTRVHSRILSWCSRIIPQTLHGRWKLFNFLLFLAVAFSCLYKCTGTFLVLSYMASLEKHSAEEDSLVMLFPCSGNNICVLWNQITILKIIVLKLYCFTTLFTNYWFNNRWHNISPGTLAEQFLGADLLTCLQRFTCPCDGGWNYHKGGPCEVTQTFHRHKTANIVQVVEKNFSILKQIPSGMAEYNSASSVSLEIAAFSILGKKMYARVSLD